MNESNGREQERQRAHEMVLKYEDEIREVLGIWVSSRKVNRLAHMMAIEFVKGGDEAILNCTKKMKEYAR